jgi:hypothetical protein
MDLHAPVMATSISAHLCTGVDRNRWITFAVFDIWFISENRVTSGAGNECGSGGQQSLQVSSLPPASDLFYSSSSSLSIVLCILCF